MSYNIIVSARVGIGNAKPVVYPHAPPTAPRQDHALHVRTVAANLAYDRFDVTERDGLLIVAIPQNFELGATAALAQTLRAVEAFERLSRLFEVVNFEGISL